MPNVSMLKNRGLHTFNNYLSAVPEGALIKADNVVIDREGVVEPRRGIKQYGSIGTTSADIAKQVMLYKDRILAHFSNTIAFDDGSGTFTNLAATFISAQDGLRTKSVEANGNLYVTSSAGIKKIAATSAATLGSAVITNAGGIKAITGTGIPNYLIAGFFTGYSKVAYRITWGTKDVNGNFIEGSPSPAIEVINQSANSCTVDLTFEVPSAVTTDYFYRVYRTAVSVSPTNDFAGITFADAGDEMNLIIEDAFVSGTQITVNDQNPDSFRQSGVPLYTNEFSGSGILQANEAPPFAKDIASYKNYTFFASTRTKHQMLINLLGTGAMQSFGGMQDAIDITSITYANPTTTIVFSANHGLVAGQKIVILGSGSVTLDGVRTLATAATNTVTITANGTGATTTNCSIYGSSVKISKGIVSHDYYFVGRPEVWDIKFDAYANIQDGSYFKLDAVDGTGYYVWFDGGGTGSPQGEPIALADTDGRIGIKATILNTDNTGALVATKVMAAVAASSYDFEMQQASDTIRFVTANSGTAANPAAGVTSISPAFIVNLGAAFLITPLQEGQGEDASKQYVRLSTFASPAEKIDDTARSLVKVVNETISEVVNAYYIFSSAGLPGKMQFEDKIMDTVPFSIQANSADVGTLFSPNIATAYSSQNEVKPNRLYFSKVSQPEAVPIVNYLDVGPKDKEILRILGLRDSLFILKEEGIYRLSGDNSDSFFVALFDNSSNLVAPDTAAILNNQIYALTSQGVVSVSETGVSIISRAIENVFTTVTSSLFTHHATASFGCGYEADRSYLLFIPEAMADTVANRVYRFNTFTQTWTSWIKEATCAIVNPYVQVNKLFVGAADVNIIEVERKTFSRDDYADREFASNIITNAIVGNNITLGSTALVTSGDALVQTQYVTKSQVEQLARKFALDNGVPNTIGNSNKDFYRNFTVIPGDSIQARMAALMTQLNSDIGSAYPVSFSSSFVVFQTEYNAVIDAFNGTDDVLLHTNYLRSTGTVDYEVSISEVSLRGNMITVVQMEPLLEGPLKHYKAIVSEIIYAPYFFQDPSLLKHVRAGTIMFENAGIAFGTLSYNTDLSSNYEAVDFSMEGDGSFGASTFSNSTWGGEGTARPFRTLIPMQKQRCRFIRARFDNHYAFYKYSILGISYTFEMGGERGYK